MSNEQASEAGRALAELGASKGGFARAAKLSPEERSASARRAAEARWAAEVVNATHTGVLNLAGREIACAVLEDGTRVLTQETFLQAIGRAGKAKAGTGSTMLVDGMPPFLAAANLKPFITKELSGSTVPRVFRNPVTGIRGFGYNALLLPMVCEVYLEASDAKALTQQQKHIADACKILYRGLARVGIVALVDEATGYQEDRARDALAEILRAFISDELRKWVKAFPDEYFRELARVKGIRLSTVSVKRPQYMGHLTNDIVYKRLAPGVLQELQRITPRADSGRRRHTFHQRLTDDVGHPKLREHLIAVITLMRACNDGDWFSFKRLLERSLPKYKEMPLFPNLND